MLAFGLLAGCSDDGDKKSSDSVCQAIDKDLVTKLTGGLDYTVTGDLSEQKQPGGANCQVANSDQTFLSATVGVLSDPEQASKKAAFVKDRETMAKTCPNTVVITGWAEGNACVEPNHVDLVALSDEHLIKLGVESTVTDVTLDQAEAIARNIADNLD